MKWMALVVAALVAIGESTAAAQELLPPQPGFTIKFRYRGGAEKPPDATYRVVSVDGAHAIAEVDRAGEPARRSIHHSYRVWFTQRVVEPQGTRYNDLPKNDLDEFVVIRPGTIRVVRGNLRYVPDPAVPTREDGTPNTPFNVDFETTYRVERSERVRVPAGSFDTFVLAASQARVTNGRAEAPQGTTRIWYAPALRWWVKIEFTSAEDDPVTGVAVEIKQR